MTLPTAAASRRRLAHAHARTNSSPGAGGGLAPAPSARLQQASQQKTAHPAFPSRSDADLAALSHFNLAVREVPLWRVTYRNETFSLNLYTSASCATEPQKETVSFQAPL
ncbi:unnamed protein product [Natator depressus]